VKNLRLLFLLLGATLPIYLAAGTSMRTPQIHFIENKGQWKNSVLFMAEIPGGRLFIEKHALTYLFEDRHAMHEIQHGKAINKLHFQAVKVDFGRINRNLDVQKSEQETFHYNYFLGPKEFWASDVKAYRKITLKNIYNGIDLELIGKQNELKLNFIVSPGADPTLIRLNYQGANALKLESDELHVKTDFGEIKEGKPLVFQEAGGNMREIKSAYRLNGNELSYELGGYTSRLPLIIDPSIVFGTFIGSNADNFGFSATYDAAGNAYGAGTVYAANFPVTAGAFDVSYSGATTNEGFPRDVFICKFSSDGSNLLYATFLGGSGNEQPHSMTVNSSGELYVMGTTTSTDFPVSSNAFDTSHNGQYDIFIARFSSNGSSLLSSTYFGGSKDDGINGKTNISYAGQSNPLPYNYADNFRSEIICDALSNVYVATCTHSSHTQGYPVLNGSQLTYGGGDQDGAYFKMNPTLTNLAFSSYLGGNGADALYGLTLNWLNELYLVGGTTSPNLPTTFNNYRGGIDIIVGRYSSGTGTQQALSIFGTTGNEQGFFVQAGQVDKNYLYILGQTNTTQNTSAGGYNQANGKHFVMTQTRSLTWIDQYNYFGSYINEPALSPSAFLVDNCDRIYVSGWGGSVNYNYHSGLNDLFNMPVTSDAFQKSTDGSDFYLAVFAPKMERLLFGTFIGGSTSAEHVDGGTSHFDKNGIVYQSVCAGCGGYSDFPTTLSAWSRTNPGKRPNNPLQGGCNLAMFKFDLRTYLSPPEFKDTVITIEANENLEFKIVATDAGMDIMDATITGTLLNLSSNPAILSNEKSVPGRYEITLNWKADCRFANLDTLVINLLFTDNACPEPRITKGVIKIVVRSYPPEPPYPHCLRAINDNTVELKWNPPADISKLLNYTILRSSPGNPFVLFDSAAVNSSNTYRDPTALNHINLNYCFQLISLNTCRLPSDTSRKICSINKDDTLTDIGFSSLEQEFITLFPNDTLFLNYRFTDTDPMDSVFLQWNTTLPNKNLIIGGIGNQGYADFWARWITDCTSGIGDTFSLSILLYDNQCPSPRRKTKLIRIFLSPYPSIPPPTLSCPRRYSDENLEIRWSALTPNTWSKNWILLESINGSDWETVTSNSSFSINTFSITKPFNFENNYCYRILTQDICNSLGDTSKPACTGDLGELPPPVSIQLATVNTDNSVQIHWEKANPSTFWRYELYKREGRGLQDYKLLSLIGNASDTQFRDKKVDVNSVSYCYKVYQTNDCGLVGKAGKEACTMVLQGQTVPIKSNELYWMNYPYFQKGLDRYEIVKEEPGNYSDSIIGQSVFKFEDFSDPYLNPDMGLYAYRILAFDAPGKSGLVSQSNRIELVHPPFLEMPNAFTPNGDKLNDELHSVHLFVKDYHLRLYNRWGELIWESRNKKEGFEGERRSKELASDVYFYQVDFSGWDGSTHAKKGTVTIIR